MFYQLRIGVTSTEPKLRFLLKNSAYVFISNYFFLKKITIYVNKSLIRFITF